MTRKLIILTLLSFLLLAACESTGDTTEDPEAVQNFFPQVPGYNMQQTTNIQDAVTTAMSAAGISSGNLVGMGVVIKLDDFVDCYREVGAFDARVYVEQPSDDMIQEGVRPPRAGVVVLVNQNRLMDNLMPCMARAPSGPFSAQDATPEPCYGNGEFVFNEDTFGYLYAATDQPLCDQYQQHFNQYQEAQPN